MHTMLPDERRQAISDAIREMGSLPDRPNEPLLRRLEAELRAIDRGQRNIEVSVEKTVQWLNELVDADTYVHEVRQDPLNEFKGRPASSLHDVGSQILELRDAEGGQFGNLSALRSLGENADVIIDDLIYTGASRDEVTIPEPNVGVMLPVRLETRFYEPDASNSEWRLRVRIVPDEPFMDRHDQVAFKDELDSVEWLWQNAPDGLDSERGRVAWQQFAARHGPARAAWLARTFPPLPRGADGSIRVNRPESLRDTPSTSRVRGLPTTIELWMARAGGAPERVAITPVHPAHLSLEFSDPADPSDQRWWSSWDEAVNTGLGVELILGASRPDDIDVLYAIGFSDEDTIGLFQAHRDQGALGLIEPGTPTNTVDSAPAANLGQDAEAWRRIVANPGAIGWGSGEVSRALTGKEDALGPLIGDGFDHRNASSELIQALWMVLWGHSLKDIWGLGEDVYLAGLWAGRFVAPEGPLPTLRINEQPYGLLPTTSINGFRPGDAEPSLANLESRLLPHLRAAEELWARMAEAEGNVTGADTERLLQLLGRTPSGNSYAYRYSLSLELLELVYFAFNGVLDAQTINEWWHSIIRPVEAFGVRPVRRYTSIGWPQDLTIPLVASEDYSPQTTFRDYLSEFIEPDELIAYPLGYWLDVGEMNPFDRLPVSLLARLLLLARFIAAAEVRRAAQGRPGPALEPIGARDDALTKLAEDALEMTDEDLNAAGTASELYFLVEHSISAIMERQIGELDRVFRSVLDTAAWRIDPWITALAWHRLQESIPAGHAFHLGLYGWVDRPQPGTPGPTDGGLLHAPSEAQAVTAAILRDKALHDPQPDRWHMNLESRTIRLADRLADEVRLGAHLGEVLGREVERIAGSPALVKQLREDFPLRTEHAGRRVCDGMKILRVNPVTLPFSDDQRASLEELRRALDTYGDLLVSEAVHHVVSGRGDVAAAAMDAAAGLGIPPSLEVISTRRTGRALNTNVIVALQPAPNPNEDTRTGPVQIADPAVAAYLESEFGPADAPEWHWTVLGPRDIFLADIGLSVAETLVLSEEELLRIVLMFAGAGSILDRHWRVEHPDGSRADIMLSDLGLADEVYLGLSDTDLEQRVLTGTPDGTRIVQEVPHEGTRMHRLVRQRASVLGRQPALPADMLDNDTFPDDAPVREELHERYTRLHNVAVALHTELVSLIGGGSEQELAEALVLAARWGITPVVQVGDTLARQVEHAAAALQDRIERSPLPDDITDLDAARLATRIAELAAPEGQIPVLGLIDLSDWPTVLASAQDLDSAWLPVNASVRDSMARLEAEQLEGLLSGAGSPFATWTNRPGDPWQVDVPASQSGAKAPTRLIAIYGGPESLPEDPVNWTREPLIAAGLLDNWGETTPDVDQSTTAVFGFNAPAARAPQAILLAVPPEENSPLTTEVLVEIVASTRQLAHARMATPSHLTSVSAAIPSMMLPASGVTGVPLS